MARKQGARRASASSETTKPSPDEAGYGSSAVVDNGIDRAKIAHVFVDDCSAKRSVSGFDGSIEPRFEMLSTGEDVGPNPASDGFYMRVNQVVRVFRKDASEREDPEVEIKARMVGLFLHERAKEFGDEDFKAFAAQIGIFVLWPYWREFVNSMSLRLSIAPIIIPMLQVQWPSTEVVTRFSVDEKPVTYSGNDESDDVSHSAH